MWYPLTNQNYPLKFNLTPPLWYKLSIKVFLLQRLSLSTCWLVACTCNLICVEISAWMSSAGHLPSILRFLPQSKRVKRALPWGITSRLIFRRVSGKPSSAYWAQEGLRSLVVFRLLLDAASWLVRWGSAHLLWDVLLMNLVVGADEVAQLGETVLRQ